MKELLIAAFPQAFLTMVVAEETEDVDAQEIYRENVPAPDMLNTIERFMTDYPDIKGFTFYGAPQDFIAKLVKDASIVYPDMPIHCEVAGQ